MALKVKTSTHNIKHNIMDEKIKYVCKEFKLHQYQLLSISRNRRITSARGVLYALCYKGSYYRLQSELGKKCGFHISRSSIKKGIQMAQDYYNEKITGFNEYLINN